MAVASALGGYTAETVAKDLGIDAKQIRKAADALWGARGAALVLAGGISSRNDDSISLQVVVNLLNSALDADGVTVDSNGFSGAKVGAETYGSQALKKLIADMRAAVRDDQRR